MQDWKKWITVHEIKLTGHQIMPPNISATYSSIKRSCRGKQKQLFGDKVQDWKKWITVHEIKLTGGQEIKLVVLVKF